MEKIYSSCIVQGIGSCGSYFLHKLLDRLLALYPLMRRVEANTDLPSAYRRAYRASEGPPWPSSNLPIKKPLSNPLTEKLFTVWFEGNWRVVYNGETTGWRVKMVMEIVVKATEEMVVPPTLFWHHKKQAKGGAPLHILPWASPFQRRVAPSCFRGYGGWRLSTPTRLDLDFGGLFCMLFSHLLTLFCIF